MQALRFCEHFCVLAGLLKIVAELNQSGALTAHGRIFLHAVSVRHHDRHRDIEPLTGESDRLAVIAAGGGDHAP